MTRKPTAPLGRNRIATFALVLTALVALHVAAAYAQSAAAAASTTGGTRVLREGEKQRVPRPPSEPRTKPGSGDSGSNKQNDDDSGPECFDNCFVGGSSEPAPAPVAVDRTRVWSVNDPGWLHADEPGGTLVLRAGPSPADSIAGLLPDATHIVVLEVHEGAQGTSLRVRPADALDPAGWLPVSSVVKRAPRPQAGASAATVRPARTAAPWSGQVIVELGGLMNDFTPAGSPKASEEYDMPGVHAGIGAVRPLGASGVLECGVDYWNQAGSPDVAMYTTATRWDTPVSSHFEAWALTTKAGAWFGTPRARLRLSAGPALFLIRERARIVATDPQDHPLGTFTEAISRLAGGGVFQVAGLLRRPSGVEFGLVTSIGIVAWKGHEERSLSLDFVEPALVQFHLGVLVACPVR